MTEDRTYFERRAEEELRLAEVATRPEAVRAHYELANLHLERAYPDERPSRPGPARRTR